MLRLSPSRSGEIEILDSGRYEREELHGNVSDLARYNRRFGTTRRMARAIRDLLSPDDLTAGFSLLDVGTGLADIPSDLALHFSSRGIPVTAEGIDASEEILEEARRYHGKEPGRIRLRLGDATDLPYPDGSFDVVICSTFLHHLDAEEAVTALREMGRVSARGIVAIDLVRSRTALACIWLLTRLTSLNRLTRNDGPLSVRRAFTPEELSLAAARAGLEAARVRPLGPARMILTWSASPR